MSNGLSIYCVSRVVSVGEYKHPSNIFIKRTLPWNFTRVRVRFLTKESAGGAMFIDQCIFDDPASSLLNLTPIMACEIRFCIPRAYGIDLKVCITQLIGQVYGIHV